MVKKLWETEEYKADSKIRLATEAKGQENIDSFLKSEESKEMTVEEIAEKLHKENSYYNLAVITTYVENYRKK